MPYQIDKAQESFPETRSLTRASQEALESNDIEVVKDSGLQLAERGPYQTISTVKFESRVDLAGEEWSIKEFHLYSKHKLLGYIETSAYCNTKYVPFDGLIDVINSTFVRRLLEASPTGSIGLRHKVNLICGIGTNYEPWSMRRIVAILVLIDKHESLVDFFFAQVGDANLPLKIETDQDNAVVTPMNKTLYDLHTTCFSIWPVSDIIQFLKYQQYFLSPFFDFTEGKLRFYKLWDVAVLPFTEYEKTPAAWIWRIRIHDAHHNFRDSSVIFSSLRAAMSSLADKTRAGFEAPGLCLPKTPGEQYRRVS